MSMPPWLRANINTDTIEKKIHTEKPTNGCVCTIAPTAEHKDPIGTTLAEHDAKFHPTGLKPSEPCKFREAFIDEPAETTTTFFQEISATPVNEIQPTAETVAVKKPNKKPGRKAKK